jgi:hypothetical protein
MNWGKVALTHQRLLGLNNIEYRIVAVAKPPFKTLWACGDNQPNIATLKR